MVPRISAAMSFFLLCRNTCLPQRHRERIGLVEHIEKFLEAVIRRRREKNGLTAERKLALITKYPRIRNGDSNLQVPNVSCPRGSRRLRILQIESLRQFDRNIVQFRPGVGKVNRI